jgi:hypothetical protein
MSGRKTEKDRPGFAAMLKAAHQRKFDIVVFWALDRLTREGTRATLNYLQRLESKGVGYVSYQEQWLDSTGPFKDVMISMFATLAKQERARISERTIAGLNIARAKGKRLGRPPWRLMMLAVKQGPPLAGPVLPPGCYFTMSDVVPHWPPKTNSDSDFRCRGLRSTSLYFSGKVFGFPTYPMAKAVRGRKPSGIRYTSRA